jgi:hypothetical protein
MLTETEKHSIVQQLESESMIRGISTDLAIQAGEQQEATKIPEEYQDLAQVFDDKASQRFPPSREWDHAINLKPGAPDCHGFP